MAKVRLSAPDLTIYERVVYSVLEAMGVLMAHTNDYTQALVIDERGFAVTFNRTIGEQVWRLVG